MNDKRRAERIPANIPVEYSLIKVEFGFSKKDVAEGTILDISDLGFGIKTEYPLEKGHVISIINSKGDMPPPSFGMTMWVKKVGDIYRAGFSCKLLGGE